MDNKYINWRLFQAEITKLMHELKTARGQKKGCEE